MSKSLQNPLNINQKSQNQYQKVFQKYCQFLDATPLIASYIPHINNETPQQINSVIQWFGIDEKKNNFIQDLPHNLDHLSINSIYHLCHLLTKKDLILLAASLTKVNSTSCIGNNIEKYSLEKSYKLKIIQLHLDCTKLLEQDPPNNINNHLLKALNENNLSNIKTVYNDSFNEFTQQFITLSIENKIKCFKFITHDIINKDIKSQQNIITRPQYQSIALLLIKFELQTFEEINFNNIQVLFKQYQQLDPNQKLQKILSNTSLQKLQLLKNHLEQKSPTITEFNNRSIDWINKLRNAISNQPNKNILKQKLLQKVINFKIYNATQLNLYDYYVNSDNNLKNIYVINEMDYSGIQNIKEEELDLLKNQFLIIMHLNIVGLITEDKVKEICESPSEKQSNLNHENVSTNQIKKIREIKNQYIQHHKQLLGKFIDQNGKIILSGLGNITDKINSLNDYFDKNNEQLLNSYSIALPINENIPALQWQDEYEFKKKEFADLFDSSIQYQDDRVNLCHNTQDQKETLHVVNAIFNGMNKLNVDEKFLQELELLSISKLKRIKICENKELEQFIKLSIQKNNRCTAHMLSKYFIDRSNLLVSNNEIYSDTLLQKKQSIYNAIENLNQTFKLFDKAHKEWKDLDFLSPLNCGLLECGGFIIGRLKLGALFSFFTKFALLIICTIPLFAGRLVALKYYDHKIKNIKENLELKKNFFEKIEQELKYIQIDNIKIKEEKKILDEILAELILTRMKYPESHINENHLDNNHKSNLINYFTLKSSPTKEMCDKEVCDFDIWNCENTQDQSDDLNFFQEIM